MDWRYYSAKTPKITRHMTNWEYFVLASDGQYTGIIGPGWFEGRSCIRLVPTMANITIVRELYDEDDAEKEVSRLA